MRRWARLYLNFDVSLGNGCTSKIKRVPGQRVYLKLNVPLAGPRRRRVRLRLESRRLLFDVVRIVVYPLHRVHLSLRRNSIVT